MLISHRILQLSRMLSEEVRLVKMGVLKQLCSNHI
jgi:hypothetical protein